MTTYVLNPLRTNLYRKSLSLRKRKPDRADARTIAAMLLSDGGLKPYTATAYRNEELKSLTRYRFDRVKERAQLKQSVSRLVCILFPELEKMAPTLHSASVYALLSEFPGAEQIADTHLTRLKALLADASRGRYGRDMAVEIRDAARCSIGSRIPAKSLELQHTIHLIRELDAEIGEIETAIHAIMDELRSPITTIPGIGYRMGAMILAESGDLSRFDSPDELLAYAGMSPSTYQSGKLKNCYPHMEKRGSRYLRYALYNAANMFATGTRPLPLTWLRSGLKASITTLPYLTPLRNRCVSSLPWRGLESHIVRQSKFPLFSSSEGLLTLCFSCPF